MYRALTKYLNQVDLSSHTFQVREVPCITWYRASNEVTCLVLSPGYVSFGSAPEFMDFHPCPGLLSSQI